MCNDVNMHLSVRSEFTEIPIFLFFLKKKKMKTKTFDEHLRLISLENKQRSALAKNLTFLSKNTKAEVIIEHFHLIWKFRVQCTSGIFLLPKLNSYFFVLFFLNKGYFLKHVLDLHMEDWKRYYSSRKRKISLENPTDFRNHLKMSSVVWTAKSEFSKMSFCHPFTRKSDPTRKKFDCI